MTKRWQPVCSCSAYRFPHREGGGYCEYEDGVDMADYDSAALDRCADDPRRGQAAWISAINRGVSS
jgi:hypothetical protein